MQQTPFHAYYTARTLDSLSNEDGFVSAFASSDIKIYPFQIAAANFALRSPYQKGVILCDEAGMGKSHEAMLIIVQKWLEGQSRILLVTPNADLLMQWTEMIECYYTIPFIVLTNREEWNANISYDNPNAFLQDAIVISTYDFVMDNQSAVKDIHWDLTVFEEANALSSVYREDNKRAKTLKCISDGSFKLLLTGTPIEKSIMDLYGLIWFIDETILPDEQDFLSRYLRKPENYPELAESVNKYCFHTLRSQAKEYAKIPNRILITNEYTVSPKEQELYDLLYAYINKQNKIAFPEMDQYDLALRLLSLQSSSTAAILQTIKGVIKRLETMPDAQDEIAKWRKMQAVAQSIPMDAKAKQLLIALKSGFALMKKSDAKKTAVIFTESIETQKMLTALLSDKYKTCVYNGSANYSAILEFKTSGEILLSTDNGAKGFNLEDAAFVVHYDLPYNTLKMEQRIDRCHRLGQENDVISLAFIDKNNFADVRKLELVNKRMLVADGVFGITDEVIGGFTGNLNTAFETMSKRIRTRAQVETDYQQVLIKNEAKNKQLISSAEDALFTTFTKDLADKITISPRYISEKAEQINTALWSIVKYFFEQYNETHDNCIYVIDDNEKTITATNYEKLPILFYYWTGSRNKPYQSLKSYGMAKDYKPHHGRITLTSIIGRGIIHELECSEYGILKVKRETYEPCEIGLYSINLSSAANKTSADIPVLIGKTQSGKLLTEEQCKDILKLSVTSYGEEGHKNPHWLKSSRKPHELDHYVSVDDLIARQSEKLSQSQAEEIDQMKLKSKAKKTALTRDLDALNRQIKAIEVERETITNDRLKLLALDKKTNLLRQEYMKKQESQFFNAMKLDLELEEQIKKFTEKEKLTAKVTREFVLKVEGNI